MFTPTEYEILSLPYFNTVSTDPAMYEIQSKNTGHYWALVPTGKYITLLHKYHESDEYHYQTQTLTVLDAVLEIVNHDDYKLHHKGRTFFDELVEKYA